MKLKFSEDIKVFDEVVKLYYDSYYKGKLCAIIPLLVYHREEDDFWDDNLKFLFKTHIHLKNIKPKKLKRMSKCFRDAEWFIHAFTDFDLKALEDKVNKWVSTEILEPIPFQEGEFILTDKNTSFYGNYELDSKQGCLMKFGKNPHYKPLESFNVNLGIYYHNLPYLKNIDGNSFYELTPNEKLELVKSLGEQVFINTFHKSFPSKQSLEESHLQFKIRLSGNNDDSWTRYFETEEQMMQELYRLRRCQPINKLIDVQNNGYYFTN